MIYAAQYCELIKVFYKSLKNTCKSSARSWMAIRAGFKYGVFGPRLHPETWDKNIYWRVLKDLLSCAQAFCYQENTSLLKGDVTKSLIKPHNCPTPLLLKHSQSFGCSFYLKFPYVAQSRKEGMVEIKSLATAHGSPLGLPAGVKVDWRCPLLLLLLGLCHLPPLCVSASSC